LRVITDKTVVLPFNYKENKSSIGLFGPEVPFASSLTFLGRPTHIGANPKLAANQAMKNMLVKFGLCMHS